MAIEECFEQMNYVDAVFDPIPSYAGYWTFSIDNLFENSLKDNNGKPLFNGFYSKTYQEPILKIFKNERILKFLPFMVSLPNENLIGRCLKYSEHHFYIALINLVNEKVDSYQKSKEEQKEFINNLILEYSNGREAINNALVEALKVKCARLKDVLDNEFNSEFFEAAREDYDLAKKDEEFSTYIKSAYEFFNDLMLGIPKLGDFFDRKIDYQELAKCFLPDTFSLLFAKIIYEFCITNEKENLPNCYCYLKYYQNAINNMVKTNKKYDPRITFILPSTAKLRRYSRWSLKEEVTSLLERHPEAKEIKIPALKDGQMNEYKDIRFMEKFNHLYDSEITLNWVVLPEGEKIYTGKYKDVKEPKERLVKDRDTLIKEVNERILTLENSGFIGRPLKGLQECFKGYFAFFYPNGVVILEKFWENEEKSIPAKPSATYVMNIDNFLTMSKMPRIELIDFIKTIPNAKRIYHTSFASWQTGLYEAINNPNMSEKITTVIDFIQGLETENLSHE